MAYNSYQPILEEDIKEVINTLKATAARSDGVRINDEDISKSTYRAV